ncbi:MAG: hypothetical protein NTV46_00170 [Verrucomicrobia bacterium]|nr:hypothetical protein [Verrucomicrobiota bacterium]
MRSIGTGDNIEVRHFMDDEHQITIGIDRNIWTIIQRIANQTAIDKQWLDGKGSEWEYLNCWIIDQLSRCSKEVDAHEWISQAAE